MDKANMSFTRIAAETLNFGDPIYELGSNQADYQENYGSRSIFPRESHISYNIWLSPGDASTWVGSLKEK